MISKRALDREISEYEDGKLDRTNARDLAALYTIRSNLYPQILPAVPDTRSVSGAGYVPDGIPDYGESPFFSAIAGKDPEKAWKVMEQLMDTLAAVYEPLYRQVIRQLNEI